MAVWQRLAPFAFALGLSATGAAQSGGFGPSWTHHSGTQSWVPKNVTLGDRGGQVLTQFGPGYDFTRLFSATDSNPAAAIWQNDVSVLTYNQRTASADVTDVYVTLHDEALSSATRRLVLRKFRSSSATPDWTSPLPTITNTHSLFDVGVSDDGSRIVVATVNPVTADVDVYVFGPASPTPLTTASVRLFGFMRAMDLSPDGSRLMLSSDLYVKVIDTADGSEVDAIPVTFTPLSLSASNGGEVIAYGGMNAMVVAALDDEDDYDTVFFTSNPGTWFCRAVDVSADGETLASAFVGYGAQNVIRVQAFDVDRSIAADAGVETMRFEQITTGQYTNGVAGLEVSSDGAVFAVGMWGDQSGQAPEVMVFANDQDTPTHAHDLPGSVQAIDLSADGKRLAVASKAVHNNVAGSGGRLDLYDLERGDLRLHGVPQQGQSVRIELEGQPGRTATLLVARSLANQPSEHPGVGLMHLDRKGAWKIPMGTFDANGVATLDYQLPSGGAGMTLYFQGGQEGPSKLSESWLKVTVLP